MRRRWFLCLASCVFNREFNKHSVGLLCNFFVLSHSLPKFVSDQGEVHLCVFSSVCMQHDFRWFEAPVFVCAG